MDWTNVYIANGIPQKWVLHQSFSNRSQLNFRYIAVDSEIRTRHAHVHHFVRLLLSEQNNYTFKLSTLCYHVNQKCWEVLPVVNWVLCVWKLTTRCPVQLFVFAVQEVKKRRKRQPWGTWTVRRKNAKWNLLKISEVCHLHFSLVLWKNKLRSFPQNNNTFSPGPKLDNWDICKKLFVWSAQCYFWRVFLFFWSALLYKVKCSKTKSFSTFILFRTTSVWTD